MWIPQKTRLSALAMSVAWKLRQKLDRRKARLCSESYKAIARLYTLEARKPSASAGLDCMGVLIVAQHIEHFCL